MATVCLNRAAKAFRNADLDLIARRNLANNLRTTFRLEGGLGYIWMDGSAKLGALALAALAIFESPERPRYLKEEYSLRRMIELLSNTDGSFDTFYIPRERKDNQNFYSGEALLFLAENYTVTKSPADLKRFMAAFYYYREWHFENRNPAFVPWHTQAYFLVWKVTRDDALKDFIFEMNDWLLSMQQWEAAPSPDMRGRFHDPQRPQYGPPHSSSTGVYLEGLIDAFELAREIGDNTRLQSYRIAIVRGIRSIMQLQYKSEAECFYVKNIEKVLGGVRTTVYDNGIRIDNVQHGLMALLKIANRFTSEDYSLNNRDKYIKKNDAPVRQKFNPNNISDKSSLADTNDVLFFRLKDFKVDIHKMRRDFEASIRDVPAIPYHHAGVPYEGWAITSRDGSASDGVKRISGKARVLNGVKVEDATIQTELCTDFISDILKQLEARGLKCFRVRYMKMGSEGFGMNFHRDAKRESWRLHIPLYTNKHCFFEWETKGRGKVEKHLPADGSAYLVRVDELHRGVNYSPGNAERIHFLLSLEEPPGAHLIDKSLVEYTIYKDLAKREPSNTLWSSSEVEEICFSQSYSGGWHATQTIMTARKQANGIYFAKGQPEYDLKYVVENDSCSIICGSKSYQYLKSKTKKPIYVVDDMFETARAFADFARARFEGKVIGITGSVGKTTIKDGLISLLSAISRVHASKGNQNADWGLLETISNTPPDADYAVYELGMLGKKSIGLKSRRAKPHIAVITNVSDAHRSFHSSDESIAETKSEILEGVLDGGIAILPADSPWSKVLYDNAKKYPKVKVLLFGEHDSSDIRLISYDCSSGGTEMTVSILGEENTFVTSLLGEQAAINCTILISVLYALGIDVNATKELFKTLRPSKQRGEIFLASCTNGSFSVIDDTWNASPASVVAAINNMKYVRLTKGASKILFIGDMLQLGKNERRKHVELVDAIVANGIDKVFTVGTLSQSLFQALPLALRGYHFSDSATASRMAKRFVGNGDVLLVKGSNAMEMWRIVQALREISTSNDVAGAQPARTWRGGAAV